MASISPEKISKTSRWPGPGPAAAGCAPVTSADERAMRSPFAVSASAPCGRVTGSTTSPQLTGTLETLLDAGRSTLTRPPSHPEFPQFTLAERAKNGQCKHQPSHREERDWAQPTDEHTRDRHRNREGTHAGQHHQAHDPAEQPFRRPPLQHGDHR